MPWGHYTLFLRRQALLNGVWNSLRELPLATVLNHGWKWGSLFYSHSSCFSKTCIQPYQPTYWPNLVPNSFWLFQKKNHSCYQEMKIWGEAYNDIHRRTRHRFQRPFTKMKLPTVSNLACQHCWNKTVPPKKVTLNGTKFRLDVYVLDRLVKYRPLYFPVNVMKPIKRRHKPL